jgi:hypothetical protein
MSALSILSFNLLSIAAVVITVLALDNQGLGLVETFKLIFTGKLKNRLAKIKLKPGDLILLKTKGGLYPAKVLLNKKRYSSIEIFSDPWVGWHTNYSYGEIELLDQEVAQALYGGKGIKK